MSNAPGIPVLEDIVHEAVSRAGGEWSAVSAEIEARLALLPVNARESIDQELQLIVSNAAPLRGATSLQ